MPESYSKTESMGYAWYTANDLSGYALSPINTHYSGWINLGSNIRAGIRNPSYKGQIRVGNNATTPYVRRLISTDSPPEFFASAESTYIYSKSTGQLVESRLGQSSGFLPIVLAPPTPSVPADVVADVHNRCIASFIDETLAAQSSENLTGRSIKHFKHDVHSIIHPMTGIRNQVDKYLTSLEKVPYGKLKTRGIYSVISSAFLEFRFGVKPFVQDVTDILTDMCIKDRIRNPVVPVRATAKSIYSTVSGVAGYNCLDAIQQYIPVTDVTITSSYSEQMLGGCRTGINDDGKLGVVQDLRLLPRDWLPTAFSILPYAWMINYFSNVREIIDAASFRFSDLTWGCLVSRDESTISYSNVRLELKPQDIFDTNLYNVVSSITLSGGNASYSSKLIDRSILVPSELVPSLEFKIPTTATPWENMMAAFGGRIGKLVSKLF